MQLRKLRVLLIPVLATALALAGSSPAHAGGGGAALGAGAVNGTVNTNPGVPTDPQAPANSNNFTFSSTEIIGALSAVNGTNVATFAGSISVTASGTASDTAALGDGTVSSLTGNGTSATGSITATLSPSSAPDNTFIRVGTAVLVILKLDVTITGPTGSPVSALIRVLVEANFVPTSDPTAATINQALFAGSFAGIPA